MQTNITNYLRIKASVLEAKRVLKPSVAIDNELIAIYKVLKPVHTELHMVLLDIANEMNMEVRV